MFSLTLFDAPIVQDGAALRFMPWEPLAKHIELMLEGVSFVWGVFRAFTRSFSLTWPIGLILSGVLFVLRPDGPERSEQHKSQVA